MNIYNAFGDAKATSGLLESKNFDANKQQKQDTTKTREFVTSAENLEGVDLPVRVEGQLM